MIRNDGILIPRGLLPVLALGVIGAILIPLYVLFAPPMGQAAFVPPTITATRVAAVLAENVPTATAPTTTETPTPQESPSPTSAVSNTFNTNTSSTNASSTNAELVGAVATEPALASQNSGT